MENQVRGARVALIGAGHHGLGAIAPAVARLPGWSIVAVADPDAGALGRVAGLLPAARLYADPAELVEESQGLDLIVVATPPIVAAEAVLTAMRTEAAILVEKPGARCVEELAGLERVARDRRATVTCGYSYRLHPTVEALERMLRSPGFGAVSRIRLRFNAPLENAASWRAARATGGGALRDLGTHLLDLALLLVGGPLRLEHATILSTGSEDDEVGIGLTAASGTCVQLRCGYGGAPEFSLTATSERHHVRADLWSMTTPVRVPIGRSITAGVLSSRLLTRLSASRRPSRLLLRSRVETLRVALGAGGARAASLADALTVLRIVEAAEYSCGREGGPGDP